MPLDQMYGIPVISRAEVGEGLACRVEAREQVQSQRAHPTDTDILRPERGAILVPAELVGLALLDQHDKSNAGRRTFLRRQLDQAQVTEFSAAEIPSSLVAT